LPSGLTHLTGLFLTGNLLTNITLPPDMTQVRDLGFLGNPLTSLVLSETLAATTNLTDEITFLEGEGIPIFTYPLTVELVRVRQPIGAFQFGITGPPGAYGVLASSDLKTWSELGFTTNRVGAIVFTDVTAHLSPRKFYRARLIP
jgi:hypothetical protein